MTPVDHEGLQCITILPGGCYHPHLPPTLRVNRAIRLLPFLPSHRVVNFTLLLCRLVSTWPLYFTLGNFLIRTSAGGPAILVTVLRLLWADRNAAVFKTNFHSRRDLSKYWR